MAAGTFHERIATTLWTDGVPLTSAALWLGTEYVMITWSAGTLRLQSSTGINEPCTAATWYSAEITCVRNEVGQYVYTTSIGGHSADSSPQSTPPSNAYAVVTYEGYGTSRIGPITLEGTDGTTLYSPWTATSDLDDWDAHAATVNTTDNYLTHITASGYVRMWRKQVQVRARFDAGTYIDDVSVAFTPTPDSVNQASPQDTEYTLIYLWKLASGVTLTAPARAPGRYPFHRWYWAVWKTEGEQAVTGLTTPSSTLQQPIAYYYDDAAGAGGTMLYRDSTGVLWRADSTGAAITVQYQVAAPKTWSSPVTVASGDYAQPGIWDGGDGYLYLGAFNNGDSKKYQWRRTGGLATWTADGEIT